MRLLNSITLPGSLFHIYFFLTSDPCSIFEVGLPLCSYHGIILLLLTSSDRLEKYYYKRCLDFVVGCKAVTDYEISAAANIKWICGWAQDLVVGVLVHYVSCTLDSVGH